MDIETWVGLDAKLRKAYNKPKDTDRAKLYYEALKAMPGPTIRMAVDALINEEKYFPNVATIRKYCAGVTRAVAAPPSFDNVCETCHGEGWVDADPIHENGLVYRNVVRRCPQCRPAVAR